MNDNVEFQIKTIYDITFHPIKEEEIRAYIFQSLQNPKQGWPLFEALGKEKDTQDNVQDINLGLLKGVYDRLPKSYAFFREKGDLSSLVWDTASVAGYLHPWWYNINAPLHQLPSYQDRYLPLIESISHIETDLFKGTEEKFPGQLPYNYTGGGYIPSKNITKFRELLKNDCTHDPFLAPKYAHLIFALDYAHRHKTGVLEADGIRDRMRKYMLTYPKNIKTKVLRTDEPTLPILCISAPEKEKDLDMFARDLLNDKKGKYGDLIKIYL